MRAQAVCVIELSATEHLETPRRSIIGPTLTGVARAFRFGVAADGGEVSPYFKVSTSARGDVYIACDRMHDGLHMSLHESRDHWHLKSDSPRGSETIPIIPAEVDPSITCAFTLTIPGRAAVLRRPNKDVLWIARDEGDLSRGVAFRFFVQLPVEGAMVKLHDFADVTVVGRFPLAEFGALTVTAQPRESPPPALLRFEVLNPDAGESTREQLAADLRGPESFMLLHLTVRESTEFLLAPRSAFKLLS